MTEQHELIDFVKLAAQLTNEQKILACLERIEVLLTPPQLTMEAPEAPKPAPKKPFGRK